MWHASTSWDADGLAETFSTAFTLLSFNLISQKRAGDLNLVNEAPQCTRSQWTVFRLRFRTAVREVYLSCLSVLPTELHSFKTACSSCTVISPTGDLSKTRDFAV